MKISDPQYEVLKEWVHNYIDTKCIVRNTEMPGKLPGSTYTWMFYLRKGLFNHQFLINISQMFIYHMERLDPKFNFQLTGLETAATPMLAAIPMVGSVMGVDINAFVVRNSSRSMAQCLNTLTIENIPVANVAFSIVNKSNKDVHNKTRLVGDMYLPKEIKVISLFDLDDFDLNNPSH